MNANIDLAYSKVEEIARAAIADVPLPKEVLETRFSSSEDSEGDPVLRVILTIEAGEIDAQVLRQLVDSIYAIRDRLLASDIDRFPHVSLEQAA